MTEAKEMALQMFNEVERLRNENARYREALRDIACYDDRGANDRLAITGSYSMFDEPGSVQRARLALSDKR